MATILVVDDRALNREFLASLLGYAGHVVLEAADGDEALDVASSLRPDLIISDVLMPGMDGVEFANRLHADAAISHIPLVFYTATYRLDEVQAMAARCGVARVLAKPSEPETILQTVAAMLGTAPAAGQPAETAPPPGQRVAPASSNLAALAQRQQQLRERTAAGATSTSGDTPRALPPTPGLSLRLSALVELGLQMATERDPQQLLALFTRAARDIMNVRYVALGLVDAEGQLQHLLTEGLPDATRAALAAGSPAPGVLRAVLDSGTPYRAVGAAADPLTLGLPASHPPFRSLLAVAVKAATRTLGWLYVADRLSSGEPGDEDDQLAVTLAAQLALTYENLTLYQASHHHAAALEQEVADRRRAEETLREQQEHYRKVIDMSADSLFVVQDGRIVMANPATLRMFGATQPAQLYEIPMWDLIDADYHELIQARIRQADLQDTPLPPIEPRLLRLDGTPFDAETSSTRFSYHGEPAVLVTARDISLRKDQERKIARLGRLYALLTGINAAIVRVRERQALFDETCRVAVQYGGFGMAWVGWVDPDTQDVHAQASSGMAPDMLKLLNVSARPDIPAGLGTAGEALRSGEAAVCNDMRTAAHVGLLRGQALAAGYRSLVALPLMLDGTAVGVVVLYAREVGYFDDQEMALLADLAGDISFALQYLEREERIQYLANYDVLTNLPNAMLFRDRLTQLVQTARRERQPLSVLMVDLDRFKHLNDTLGRHVGDMLLRQVADRLAATLPEACTVAHLGADTFAVAVPYQRQGDDAEAILREHVFGAFKRPFGIGDKPITLTVTASIALFPADGEDADTLYQNAEAALKHAKAVGEPYQFYSPEINAQLAERLALEEQLRAAIEAGQFVLHYQPRVDLMSGRIVGAEALIRWQHPALGIVPPSQFIPLAEETGLILPIGEWVIRAVCTQQVTWQGLHLPIVPVALNLSAAQFQKPGLVALLRDTLTQTGLDPHHLELELTESAVMRDPEEATRTLRALRELGLRLALDDFGTGYSSLAYLKRFPFDQVKIDRAFVVDITRNPEDAGIATAVIAMAHHLNLCVVAEGVETEAQLQFLRRHGCDQIQGFYFSRPVPADTFIDMLCGEKRLDLGDTAAELQRTLLLVDDEPHVLTSLKRTFATDGYRLLTAESGEAALELLAVNPVQVIVCDQRMPQMSGSQFFGIVKALYPDTIRIILSGYADLQTVTSAVNDGAVYKFLTKPWHVEQLREHVRDAFQRYRPTR